MALDSATQVGDLDATTPGATDDVSEGDDHIRTVKTCLTNSLGSITGAVTATHTELNYLDLSAAIGTVTASEALVVDASKMLDGLLLGDANSGFADTGDTTKDLYFSLGGATTGKTMTIISSHTDDRSLTLPNTTDTLVGKATTDLFTNKSFNANGTGNALTNVDVEDLADSTAGELITWDAAGAPAVVAVGTSGQVLTSNGAGAAPTFQTASVAYYGVIQGSDGSILSGSGFACNRDSTGVYTITPTTAASNANDWCVMATLREDVTGTTRVYSLTTTTFVVEMTGTNGTVTDRDFSLIFKDASI